MFKDIADIKAICMGNSLESCKKDVYEFSHLFSKMKIENIVKIECNPLEELINFCNAEKEFCNDKDNLLIIHFSGHGKIFGEKINGKVQMVSSWIFSPSSNNIDTGVTSSYEVDIFLSTLNCNILLISDSCHSGNFLNNYKENKNEKEKKVLFIGSSVLLHTSEEDSKQKLGILVLFFKMYLNSVEKIKNIDHVQLKKDLIGFYRRNGIRSNPTIKKFN